MNFGKIIADAATAAGGKIKGVVTAIQGLTKVQAAIAGIATITVVGGVGTGGYFLYDHFHQPEVVADVLIDTEEIVAEEVIVTEETEAVEPELVSLVGTSIEKDLKIKIQDADSRNVKNQPFEITVIADEKNAKPATYQDDDQDGIIYIKKIDAGDYIVSLNEIEGFMCEDNELKVTVKDKIAYEKVDVSDEIKDASEVSAAEDAEVDNVEVEGVLADTVELLPSTCVSQKVSGADVDTSNFTKASKAGSSAVTITPATVTASRNSVGYRATGTDGVTESTQSTETEEPGSKSTGGDGGNTTKEYTYQIIHEFYEADGTKKAKDSVTQTIEGGNTPLTKLNAEDHSNSGEYKTENSLNITVVPDVYSYTIKWVKAQATTYSYKITHHFSDAPDVEQSGTAKKDEVINATDYKDQGYTTTATVLSLTVSDDETKNVLEITWTKAEDTAAPAKVSCPQTATLYNCAAAASNSLTLSTTLDDKNGIIEKIDWVSGNTKIVTVSDGSVKGCKITAVAVGTAKITGTITYKDGTGSKTATDTLTCTVTVKNLSDTGVNLKDKSGRALYKDSECKSLATLADYKVNGTYYTAPQYTGWQTINGKVYYYNSNHQPVTGTQVISGITYNFGADGAVVQGSGSNGIDVSSHQGSIDWAAVKAAGINFAIIRVGYRGSQTGALVEDAYFKKNIQGATANGIKVGVYFFTQAVTEAEAVEEASMALSLTSGYNLSYPIFVDTENGSGNARANGLDKATRTACVSAFCKTIQNGGRKAGVYASKNWYNTKIDASVFSNYCIWVAQYNTTCNYTGKYNIWQYSSKGSVPGIKGNVDVNISYM